jgi:hypothetical protein
LCLRLFLLSSSHHFHSICNNDPLFLVMQVDFILNSRLWVRPSPILELQHALLALKCCELGSVLQPLLLPSFHSGTHFWVSWKVCGRIILPFHGTTIRRRETWAWFKNSLYWPKLWQHYKKTWVFRRSKLIKMSTLTKGNGCFD